MAISFTDDEMEEARQDELTRLPQRCGSMEDAVQRYMTAVGTHEVLHLAYVLTEVIEQQLLTHPVCVLNRSAWRLAHQAHTAMFNLYQEVSGIQDDLQNTPD